MNLQWARTFVELVKAGASLKAYQKKLGLSREQLQVHLGKLAEYEALLETKKPEPVAPKPASKVAEVIRRVTRRLDDKIVEHKEDEKDEKTEESDAS